MDNLWNVFGFGMAIGIYFIGILIVALDVIKVVLSAALLVFRCHQGCAFGRFASVCCLYAEKITFDSQTFWKQG